MFEHTDAAYLRRKAAEERQKARETMDVEKATTCLSLSEKYLARAEELAPEPLPGD
jgi:hypothetical protein